MARYSKLALACLGVVMSYACLPAMAVDAATGARSCSAYDALQPRGTRAPLTSTCDTLDPELLGSRRWMADQGWLLETTWNAGIVYDVRGHGEHPQLYSGQNASYSTTASVYFTYDLARVGFAEGSQLVGSIWSGAFSYKGDVPGGISMYMLYVNQQFFDGRLQVQYGFDSFVDQFYGFYPGGNTTASAALGVSSLVPIQVGFVNNKPAPEINARWSWADNRWYDRLGVARSMSPQGLRADWDQNNTWGMRLDMPGAKALFVNELGYETASSADGRATWVRQGLIYNTSRYQWRDGSGRTSRNYAFYAGIDQQLTQADPDSPGKGWYVNSMYDYAPSSVNGYPKDISLIFYKLGTFRSRPKDVFSVGASYNWISPALQRKVRAAGLTTSSYSRSLAAGYITHIRAGTYWINQVTYTLNPVPAPHRPAAAIVITQLALAI